MLAGPREDPQGTVRPTVLDDEGCILALMSNEQFEQRENIVDTSANTREPRKTRPARDSLRQRRVENQWRKNIRESWHLKSTIPLAAERINTESDSSDHRCRRSAANPISRTTVGKQVWLQSSLMRSVTCRSWARERRCHGNVGDRGLWSQQRLTSRVSVVAPIQHGGLSSLSTTQSNRPSKHRELLMRRTTEPT